MKNLLFVDDEIKILQGLKRMLYPQRDQWLMFFAESGEEALKIMQETPIDIIISDLRMPQMDGVQLLQKVAELHPEVVRIVLSGYADKMMIMKVTTTAHQYLTKPCDPETIKNTINKIINLREIIFDQEVKRIVSQVKSIPVLPEIYLEIQSALKDPEISIKDIGNIISRDLALTSKIMQLVNSSFFGLYKKVSNPVQAVSLLGIDTIKSLVLSVKVFDSSSFRNLTPEIIKNIISHSMQVAKDAKLIASKITEDNFIIENSFIAGLLHDIGKLILYSEFSKEYMTARKDVKYNYLSDLDLEKELFKTTHAEVGGYLMALWAMPDYVVEALALHHRPYDSFAKAIAPLTAVYVANCLYYPNLIIDEKYLQESQVTKTISEFKKLLEENHTSTELT